VRPLLKLALVGAIVASSIGIKTVNVHWEQVAQQVQCHVSYHYKCENVVVSWTVEAFPHKVTPTIHSVIVESVLYAKMLGHWYKMVTYDDMVPLYPPIGTKGPGKATFVGGFQVFYPDHVQAVTVVSKLVS